MHLIKFADYEPYEGTKNRTDDEVLELFEQLAEEENTLVKKILLNKDKSIEEIMDKKKNNVYVYYQGFIHILNFALLDVLSTREIEASKKNAIKNILKHVSVSSSQLIEKDFRSIIEAVLKNNQHVINFSKTLLDLWESSPRKELSVNIGKVTLHSLSSWVTLPILEKLKQRIEKVEKMLINSKIPHLKEAFFGDIIVVDHFQGDTSSGFYRPALDNIYLKSYLLQNKLLEQVLIHEIGHRYYKYILNEQEKASWKEVYDLLFILGKNIAPKVGDSLFKDWGVLIRDIPPGLDTIIEIKKDPNLLPLYVVGEGPAQKEIPLITIQEKLNIFPTEYAKTDEGELFSETISEYVVGNLNTKVFSIIKALFEHNFKLAKKDIRYLRDPKEANKFFEQVPAQVINTLKEKIKYMDVFYFLPKRGITPLTPEEKKAFVRFKELVAFYEASPAPWYFPKGVLNEFLETYLKKIKEVDELGGFTQLVGMPSVPSQLKEDSEEVYELKRTDINKLKEQIEEIRDIIPTLKLEDQITFKEMEVVIKKGLFDTTKKSFNLFKELYEKTIANINANKKKKEELRKKEKVSITHREFLKYFTMIGDLLQDDPLPNYLSEKEQEFLTETGEYFTAIDDNKILVHFPAFFKKDMIEEIQNIYTRVIKDFEQDKEEEERRRWGEDEDEEEEE